ncbi:hypothetical protein ZHAS_00011874 [Anopheles sinensis]|uniref:Uncharacterized protein n=1 Tax=Anopheles sinensis TaxID=74873 RepID=A0A084W1F0_ANOSI|nr:hypothetical protein ZHAS_00011874 [Anopheles sinensis]
MRDARYSGAPLCQQAGRRCEGGLRDQMNAWTGQPAKRVADSLCLRKRKECKDIPSTDGTVRLTVR